MNVHTASDLVAFWKKFRTRQPPFVHPADEAVLRNHDLYERRRWTFRQFVADERFYADYPGFHLSLLPSPFGGDLRKANIFILLLNPGFRPLDYFAQENSAKFRRRLRKTLRQDFRGIEYPFRALDPGMSWTGGGMWWWNKLKDVTCEIAERQHSGDIRKAAREMAKRMATLELVPYHSMNFKGSRRFLLELPSVRAMIGFAQGELKQRALAGKATVIVTRRGEVWGLEECQPRRKGELEA